MTTPSGGGAWDPSALFGDPSNAPPPADPPPVAADPPPVAADPLPPPPDGPPPDPAPPPGPYPPHMQRPAAQAAPAHRAATLRRPGMLVALVVVLIAALGGGLVAAGGLSWAGLRDEPAPEPVAVSTTAPVTAEPPVTYEPEPEPPPVEPDPDAAALAELERLRAQDLPGTTFTGQYVAQLASKYPGITDPLQTTASGSNTFTAADILAEHEWLRAQHDGGGVRVVLLKSTDFGKRQILAGNYLWVTFAIGDFGGKDDVTAWCGGAFADLSAEQRLNQCAVRKLEPGR